MEVPKVLLRKNASGTYDEIGLVVGRSGPKALTLLMADGSTTEHVRAAGEATPAVGSFHHLANIAPHRVEDAITSNPTLVFKQLLVDSTKPLSARDLKAKLDKWRGAALDRAWDRARPTLHDDPDVRVRDGKVAAYACDIESIEGFLDLFPTSSLAVSEPPTPSTAPPPVEVPDDEPAPAALDAALPAEPPASEPEAEHEEIVRTPAPAADVIPAPAGTGIVVEGLPAATAQVPSEVTDTPARRAVSDLLRAVDVGGTPASDLAAAARRPLRLGLAFRKMSAASQARLGEVLSPEELALVALVGGPGKGDGLPGGPGATDQAAMLGVVDSAITELARSDDPRHLVTALLDLVHRLSEAAPLSIEHVLRVSAVVARAGQPVELSKALDAVAERLRSSGSERLSPEQLDSLARTMAIAPLTKGGGRTAVLAALHRAHPDEATQPRWWQNVDVASLAEAARGGLAPALEDDVISRTVVAPAVRQHLSTIASRSGMATIWGWPSSLARHVDGPTFARLLASLEPKDAIIGTWREAVADTARVLRLEQDLDRARQAASRDAAAREAAEDQLRRSKADLARAADQLADSRTADTAARGEHERQARIDATRAMAVLVAQVLQSPQAAADEALVRAVRHASAREGLLSVAETGARVSFDPRLHDALGRVVVPGSPVSVVRSGYNWTHASEEVLLVKAQVVPLEE